MHIVLLFLRRIAMTFLDTVKGTVGTAVDTISSVTQTLVEKNRTNAKLNRLRLVMKNESELMNRAYIALGKQHYEASKKGETLSAEKEQKLFEVIENSKAKIAKARDCYRNIVDSQNDIFYGAPDVKEYNSKDVVDITVACSNESDYDNSPFYNDEDIIIAAATDAQVDKHIEETLEEINEDLEEIEELREEQEEIIEDMEEMTEADDEESPAVELF